MTPEKPKISVVIVFYNMRREAIRTLHTLTTRYQVNVTESDYEVIVVDSNSPEPLDKTWVESLQGNFTYRFVQSDWPSPCRAMNEGIQLASAKSVVCMIDGARMLSPGILSKMIQINRALDNPFIQTIAMHIGEKCQNIAVEEGYNQHVEDQLLSTIDWQQDGYSLFNISCLAMSSRHGFLLPVSETNCFCVSREKLLEINGFDEKFITIGGGLVNCDILNQLLEDESIQPVMLLGEASFHQFHGGVATNATRAEHPIGIFLDEYMQLRGKPYSPVVRHSMLYGDIHKYSRRFVMPG